LIYINLDKDKNLAHPGEVLNNAGFDLSGQPGPLSGPWWSAAIAYAQSQKSYLCWSTSSTQKSAGSI